MKFTKYFGDAIMDCRESKQMTEDRLLTVDY